jgi:hypothetical protein
MNEGYPFSVLRKQDSRHPSMSNYPMNFELEGEGRPSDMCDTNWQHVALSLWSVSCLGLNALLSKCYYGYQIKGDEMCGPCSIHGETGMTYRIRKENSMVKTVRKTWSRQQWTPVDLFQSQVHILFRCNWFLMMPSIPTKFQYVNSPFFIFLLTHYMFQPLRAIFRWDIQLDVLRTIFTTTDPLHVHNLTYRCYMHMLCMYWVRKKIKGELTYWNFVAIDGIVRNQLDRCATGCNNQR